jgi:hypothetical protein
MENPLDPCWRKSTYSANGGTDCVEVGAWRKSSYSANGGSDCVEAGQIPGVVVVRDTKDRDGLTLAFTADAWSAFVTSFK